ncbi:MAG: PepSY domain-containing protein [Acidobacteriia bacterium]|nr:PepSY domain-containing protein [Terriglobia bacterium]
MNVVRRIYEKPRSFAAREWLFQIHLYAGLAAAVYAVVVGLTGSLLVFAPEIRDWQVKDLLTVAGSGPHIPAEKVVESVIAAYPNATVTGLGLPYSAQSTFRASIQSDGKRGSVFVNPFTGAIVGKRGPELNQDFLAWLDDLHINLLSGPTGRIVNGAGGLALLLLCLTGMVVWWPGQKYWMRAVSIRWSASWKRVNYDLHSTVGFFTLLFTLMFSASGAYFVWPKQTKALVSIVSTVRPTETAAIPLHPGAQPLPLSRLLDTASRAVPGSWLEYVSIPNEPRRALRVALMSGGIRDYPSVSNVDVDPITGEIVKLQLATRRRAGESFLVWLNALHFGNFGLVMKCLWVLMGIVPALLAITGFLMWWNRVLARKLARMRREPRLGHSTGQLHDAA